MVKQTKWIDRKFNFDFPLGIFPCLLERLRFTPIRAEIMINSIDDKILSNKPNGKWSVKEHIGHLSDVEKLWGKRIEQFLAGEKHLIAADMSNKSTTDADYNNCDTKDLLNHFKDVRSALLEKLENLDEEEVGRSALHPRLNKPMRLIDLVYFIAEHDDNELALMRSKLNI